MFYFFFLKENHEKSIGHLMISGKKCPKYDFNFFL